MQHNQQRILYPRLVNRQLTAKKRGAILFTSSGLGIITTPGSVVYSATKSYLGHLGECLASEAHQYAIDVVSIYPGTVNTRFSTRTSDEPPPPLLEKISQKSDTVAELALCGIGRATRIDSGFMAIIMRLVTRSIDANLFIRIMKAAAPKYEEDNKSNQQNGSESV
ncbi:MAG: hypothetical protein EZS28_034436 [Streblomastix strix]|uniref:Uncharacterized protein n=1 Tax=Streblomastix strix TaxID=222440 RepID=A0A5J4UHX6_9EUKA|nr:MAG: hypothetical protein EZS28_034436 [Streblomastix strix]